MKKATVTVLLLAAGIMAAAPVQAAIADTLAPAGVALSALFSTIALIICLYCVVRLRRLLRDHENFMQSVEKALRDYSAKADSNTATINDLAAGARSAVNQLSNRLVEQLDKLPAAREVQAAPPDNVISLSKTADESKAVARNPRKQLEEALATGTLQIALEPVVSVSRAEATGFEVHAALPDRAAGDPSGQWRFLRRMEGEGKGSLAARFELELIRQAARVCRRQLSGDAPSMPLQVAISKALLRDAAALDETCKLFTSQPALCPALALSLPVHILNGANDTCHDALDQLQQAGVRLACEGWRGNHLAMAKLAGRNVVAIKLSADRLLDREKLRDTDLSASSLCEAAELAGLDVIATGVRSDEDTVSLIDLGIDRMSGPRFSEPRLLREDSVARVRQV